MKRLFHKKGWLYLTMGFVMLFGCLTSFTSFAAKPDKILPSAPTNLRAASVGETSLTLGWNASTDNIGVKLYNIYKNNVKIASTTNVTYAVTGLTSAQTYQFYVKAQDAAGNISKSSSILTVTTLGVVIEPDPDPVTPPSETSAMKMVGYYAAWSAYSGFTPDKVDVSKLTHINYAFANIGSDLKIAMGYPDIDPSNFTKLKALKQLNPSLKTLIAVGGWSWSDKFSDVALTDASRNAFADSCVEFVVNNGFDGVDIDWEYPVSGGLAGNIRRTTDKQNFTLLLKALREKFDARGLIDGKKYLVTIAGAASTSYINNIELSALQQYIDYANIMTYDIHGNWDKYTDFNAPLYNNSDTSPQYKWSVDSSVKAWLGAGLPAQKIVVGVPFYGYKYSAVNYANNGLYQTYTGGVSITYANVAANYLNASGYVKYFHNQSMVPWLFNGSTFISYENEQSMDLKAQYIKANALGGAMIWELSQDPNRILLNALYNGLQ